jgi:hypothetical protein
MILSCGHILARSEKTRRRGTGNTPRSTGLTGQNLRYFQDLDGSLQGSIGVGMRHGPGVRTAGAASLGAGPKRFVDNGFDGSGATAAFGATAEATIDLLGASGEVFC